MGSKSSIVGRQRDMDSYAFVCEITGEATGFTLQSLLCEFELSLGGMLSSLRRRSRRNKPTTRHKSFARPMPGHRLASMLTWTLSELCLLSYYSTMSYIHMIRPWLETTTFLIRLSPLNFFDGSSIFDTAALDSVKPGSGLKHFFCKCRKGHYPLCWLPRHETEPHGTWKWGSRYIKMTGQVHEGAN